MRRISLTSSTLQSVAIFLILAAGSALAQSTTGTISGTVKDTTGALVPAASVTLSNAANRQSQTVHTNGEGLFVAPDLLAGEYDLTIEKAGFRKLIKKRVVLSAQDRLSVGELSFRSAMPRKPSPSRPMPGSYSSRVSRAIAPKMSPVNRSSTWRSMAAM